MVAEEGQDTDEEHGRHKEQEQHMELCMSVRQMILSSKKNLRQNEKKNKVSKVSS